MSLFIRLSARAVVLAFTLAILNPINANAFPLPKTGPEIFLQLPQNLLERFTDAYNFEGIVALNNCSGSLIRLESSKNTDTALILTNGHCNENGMPGIGEVFTHQHSSRTFRVLDPDARTLGRVTATEIIYSTMTKTDITIYQLAETYEQIQNKFHVRAFTLASQHPLVNTAIEVVSGYWQRGYSCAIESFVHELNEAGWLMSDSIRYTRPGCEVIGGTSGSPIIATGTRTVIGINNTGNDDGERCTMNNPCEIDENGKVFYQKGYSYGQETFWIYSCLDEQNHLDLTKPGCALPH